MGNRAKELLIAALIVVLVVLVVLIVLRICRNVDYRNRLRCMAAEEKRKLINGILKPFGFAYDDRQALFVTRVDAWQRTFGYEEAFDRAAPGGGMVLQCFPIYFDYLGKTWLLEIWKGQYGIAAGCEIGLYHADGMVEKHAYGRTHFKSASDSEMQDFTVILEGKGIESFVYQMRHWWLGAFRVGTYCRPENLCVAYQIHFKDPCLMEAVLEGIRNCGYPPEQVSFLHKTIVIRQHRENAMHRSILGRLYQKLVLCRNRLLRRLYLWYTRPFKDAGDRLLYLYFKTPAFFRRIIRHSIRGESGGYGVSKKAE